MVAVLEEANPTSSSAAASAEAPVRQRLRSSLTSDSLEGWDVSEEGPCVCEPRMFLPGVHRNKRHSQALLLRPLCRSSGSGDARQGSFYPPAFERDVPRRYRS